MIRPTPRFTSTNTRFPYTELCRSFGYDLCDRRLVRLCRSGAQCERHVRQAELEKPVAASRLTVIVALRRCPREDLDLPVVEPDAAIDRGDLRFDCAFVGEGKTGLATHDDGGSNRSTGDTRER